MMLAPFAENAQLDKRHTRIIVPRLAQALDQTRNSRLELRTVVVVGLHIGGPVLFVVAAPMQIDAGDYLDVVRASVSEFLIRYVQNSVQPVGLVVFKLVPFEVLMRQSGPLVRPVGTGRKALEWIAQRPIVVARHHIDQTQRLEEERPQNAQINKVDEPIAV